MTATMTAPHVTARHARPASARRQLLGRIFARTVAILTTSMALIALLGFLALAVGPRVLDYRTSVMLTSSMSPGINPGDVVVTTSLAATDMKVGQIITYHIPVDDHRIVSHRVIEVNKTADGIVSFKTKGDANAAADPWTAIVKGDTVWQVRGVVPHLGTVIQQLRATIAQPWVVIGIPIALCAWLIVGIWRKPDADQDSAEVACLVTTEDRDLVKV